jgi:hypothetical protein
VISSVRNFVVHILDADRFTIILFQILDITSNYLPGIVQDKGAGGVYPQQIYDCAIFELEIRVFDIQSGWRDAYERQREYMRRDIFMGKLNPEKFSQQLQDLNKYLDYIPIERTTLTDKTIKAYGKSLQEDEIRSITGRAIPP